RGNAGVGPIHLDGMAFICDLFSAVEIANDLNGLFEIFERRRLLAHHAAGTVAAAYAAIHSSTGNSIERGEQTCRYRRITNDRICNARAEPHVARVCSHQSEQRIGLLPQHVRIEYPAVAEAGRLRLTREGHDV